MIHSLREGTWSKAMVAFKGYLWESRGGTLPGGRRTTEARGGLRLWGRMSRGSGRHTMGSLKA